MSRSSSVLAAILLAAGLAGGGCAGSRGTASALGGPSRGKATATFTIRWPSSGRVIPAGTNRFVLRINGPSERDIYTYVWDHTASSTTETATIEIPAGSKRQYFAEARRVDNPSVGFSTATRVPFNDPILDDGELMASGIDPTPATDVAAGQKVNVNIALGTQGVPDSGTSSVDLKLNQIVADRFPAVLSFQILRDQKGDPITNVTKANFEVTEDGKPCLIADVRTVVQASNQMAISMVLDRSGSMSGRPNADLESAAVQFASLLQAGDLAEVVNFDSRIEVTQRFTTNTSQLAQAIRGQFQNFGGSTAVFDAVDRALEETHAQGGRNGIVAMTDGGDNASSASLLDVVSKAQAYNVPIFTVGLGSADESALTRMANESGGLYSPASDSSALGSIYRRIASQLSGQIQITFVSPNPSPTGAKRHVAVKLRYGSFVASSSQDYIY